MKKDLLWLRISSFAAARIILTVNNFRIFDHLQSGGKTADAVARAIASVGLPKTGLREIEDKIPGDTVLISGSKK